jgi:uncharacterized membrane protein
MTRDVLRALVILLAAVFVGFGLLYAYRPQGPGSPMQPMFGVMAAVMWLLPIVLLVVLVLLAARSVSGSRTGDRYEALARLADLRDRGVLGEDEFQREKRRILG